MDLFWKAVGICLVAAILGIVLERAGKDYSTLLTMAVSAMVFLAAASFLNPIISFLRKLETLSDLRSDMLLILLKTLGIGMTSEISAAVCTDAGNTSLGKALRFLATSAIVYISLPAYSSLIDLLQQILQIT